MNYSIHETDLGNMAIETPFNQEFVNELKRFVPSARWQSPYWIIDPEGKDQADRLLEKYYPPDNQLQTVRITWDFSDGGQPEIDGIKLVNLSRDRWSWRKRCSIKFKVISQNLTAGGSRKYPALYGSLIVETRIRPAAIISNPCKVEIFDD